jgi:hypothetical protein
MVVVVVVVVVVVMEVVVVVAVLVIVVLVMVVVLAHFSLKQTLDLHMAPDEHAAPSFFLDQHLDNCLKYAELQTSQPPVEPQSMHPSP